MERHRFRLIVLSCAAAAGLCGARVHAQQIPPSIEFRVPKPPTVALSSAGSFAVYELHVTNLTGSALTLRRVEVLNASDGRIIHTMSDNSLLGDLARPGPNVPAAERSRIGGGLRAIVYVWARIDGAAPAMLRHRLTFQRDSTDASGLTLDGAVITVAPAAAPIGPPLRGEWIALNGPSNVSGHRRLVLALNGELASGQRFGADFLQADSTGQTFTGDRSKNANFHAYGNDILAVADGRVVATKDSIPENVPGGRAVPITLETVGGNYILLDMGGGRYAFYAHVIPGSHRVRVGDRVRRGQVIARVGNSGNSTEPHLHFHVVDGIAEGTTTLGAEGIPYGLEQFELLGNCGISAAGITCDRTAPVTVRRGIPLQNQLVRFPQ